MPHNVCLKIEVPAIKISVEDFDKIINGDKIYKHEMTNKWKSICHQQPKLIKFYAAHQKAIMCKICTCAIEIITEKQFYVKLVLKRILST